MSWKLETETPGEAVWSGEDSVYDMRAAERRDAWHWMGVVCSIGGVAAAWLIGKAGANFLTELSWNPADPPSPLARFVIDASEVGGGVLLIASFALLMLWWERRKPQKWITRRWTLRASAEGFAYEAQPFSMGLDPFEISPDGTSWEVALDEVARVEIARTHDWIPAREYPPVGFFSKDERDVRAVPEVEMQSFLFLADESRRVIFTGNAAREEAARLAHSIRSWLEAQKLGRPRGASVSREGFDI